MKRSATLNMRVTRAMAIGAMAIVLAACAGGASSPVKDDRDSTGFRADGVESFYHIY